MEIGPARGMSQRPVAELPLAILDDRGESEARSRTGERSGRHRGAQAPAAAAHIALDRDQRRCHGLEGPHSAAIAIECVRGPLAGRREIELEVMAGEWALRP